MRVLFAGTPGIAVPALRSLADSRHELVGVLTAPDRARGRGRTPRPSPVKELALELGLPVLQPESLRTAARREVAALEPDILACFAYGRIFGPRFLALFPHRGLNVHPSLLPRHRGPAPISGAILAGDTETGVTVQALALEMDAGDIHAQERIPLHGTETTASLEATVAPMGGRLLVEAIDRLERDEAEPVPQDPALATYTRLVVKEDGRIDWRAPAREIERMVRAYTPWPRAFTTWGPERLAILEAAVVESARDGGRESPAGNVVPGRVVRVDTSIGVLVETGIGLLALRELQLQSRKPLEWRSFLNGVSDFVGAVLGGS